METKFTKGEWDAVIDDQQCWIDSDEGLIADLDHSDVPHQEADANAYLMATSPKMYRMLEEVFNIEHEIGGSLGADGSFYYKVSGDVFKKIGKILAEARGEHGNNT